MGKHNRWDWPGFCLIGLVMGAVVAVAPQPSRAQEAAGSESPQAAASAQEDAGAESGDSAVGEAQAHEEAAAAESESGGEAAPADSNQAAEDGTQEKVAADESGSAQETATAASGEAASGATVEEGAQQPETPAHTDGLPEESTAADGSEIPANNLSNRVPASMEEPAAGAAPPSETGKESGAAEEKELEPADDDLNTGDPLEGMNRAFFKFNDFMDKLILKPVAQLYRFILPDYVEDRIRNVVNNANSPVILANDMLQWKWGRAWDTTSRFFINTTLGVGGIWDVASSFGIDRHDEDFGQTLCVWGAKEWIYLYLPFVGPSSPRDLTGRVVDRFFDPLTYYGDIVESVDLSDGVKIRWEINNAGWARIGLSSADLIDMRARNIETINEIERTSIDFYTAVRSLYRQSRENACNDGKVKFEELPDLSEEFE